MRKGDTVICIDNKPNGSSYIMTDVPLTIGKSYIVQLKAATRGETIRVLDDENMFKVTTPESSLDQSLYQMFVSYIECNPFPSLAPFIEISLIKCSLSPFFL
jgi:hypothetical protein